jgi:hypothetical protein
MSFTFQCVTCGKTHEGMPSFGASAPLSYYEVPVEEREARCDLGSDDCVIDGEHFFVRGCIEIPVQGETEPFSWGVWVSLSQASHLEWLKHFQNKWGQTRILFTQGKQKAISLNGFLVKRRV